MKTAEEIYQNCVEDNDGLIFNQIPEIIKDFSIIAMKIYAKQVAEQALNDSGKRVGYFEYDKIINTEIKLP